MNLNSSISVSIVSLATHAELEEMNLIYEKVLEHASEKRRKEFLRGRLAAHRALKQIDAQNSIVKIERGESGQPLFPNQFLGSIAHSDHYAFAAVTMNSEFQALGIDVETIFSSKIYQQIKKIIFTANEQKLIEKSSHDLLMATLIFSAKESLYKGIHAEYQRFIDFLEVEVVTIDLDNQSLNCFFDERNFKIDFKVMEQSVFTMMALIKK